jgi:hypothetical protein
MKKPSTIEIAEINVSSANKGTPLSRGIVKPIIDVKDRAEL